ncbi:SET domain-containing protein [Flavobacterium sp. LM4]|uniref:SET domain-containing protein n=1 Tax=Flavobacterium sp. LM4 TaxID=1938609 RepID=UPI0009941AC6|nr:SET domain-containing protein [Flavobacterium sp. LM4]OOV17753.1 SET domain-containing protein-lysine N-methyltransferase [Flavobacterium sp. LM4]
MIHTDTEIRFISKEKGYGVVATKLIPKGTITWVQDDLDQIFSRDEAANLNAFIKKHLDTYSFINKYGEMVLCWDNGKFVNHSFKPSCFSTAYDFEIAIRNIFPGDELTDDYGYLNVEKPFDVIDEGTDRKKVFPNDIVTFHKEWDDLIKENAPKVLEVEQLLLDLIPKETWNEFANAVHSPHKMKSILECHYPHDIQINSTT